MTVDWAGDQPELAADVSEDDDDTAGPGKPREKFSRRGIPCATAGVEHIGECFIWVSARWMDNVTDIDENLAMRKDWLERHQAGDQDIPVAAVQELMRIHRNRWMSQRKQKLEEMASAYGSRSGAQRSLTSMHRTWAYARFGGLLWMQVVLACGDVPERAIQAANDWITKIIWKTEQRQPATCEFEARSLHRRCPPREGPPKGVNHKESEAKKARGKAAAMSAALEKQRALWSQGRSTVSWRRWREMQQEAEARKARRAVKAAIAISADPTLQAPELKMIWGDFRCRSWPHHSFPVVPRSVQRSAWGCRLLRLARSSSRIVGIGQRNCQKNKAEATTTDTASGSQESWIQSACSSMYGSSAGGRALCECPLVAAACIMLGCRQFTLLPAAPRSWPIRARACMHQTHALQK